jgi:hypothetical protein
MTIQAHEFTTSDLIDKLSKNAEKKSFEIHRNFINDQLIFVFVYGFVIFYSL